MKTLVFDIWGDYAHFRKYFTTSSPLTFSFPPKTSIYGVLGAILGLDKKEYLNSFQDKECEVAISIINEIKKTRVPINYINTKDAIDMSKIKSRTQVNLEILKDCKYRIYVKHKNNKIYEALKAMLIEKKCCYTISLGLSEFIANFNYIGEFEVEEVKGNNELVEISSIIKFDEDIKIKIEEDREYMKDTIYNEMNLERETTEFLSILYERTGKTIVTNISEYSLIAGGDRVVFI